MSCIGKVVKSLLKETNSYEGDTNKVNDEFSRKMKDISMTMGL